MNLTWKSNQVSAVEVVETCPSLAGLRKLVQKRLQRSLEGLILPGFWDAAQSEQAQCQ